MAKVSTSPQSQRDRLIDYLLRFWYREPSKCMNRRWIEEHADEILELVTDRPCTMVIGVADMRHDLAEYLPEMTWREKLTTWLRFYFKPTKFWLDPLTMWWLERRFGPIPPIEKDRVAHHFGFVEGIGPCTDGPECAEHGWPLSPLVTDHNGPSSDTPENPPQGQS